MSKVLHQWLTGQRLRDAGLCAGQLILTHWLTTCQQEQHFQEAALVARRKQKTKARQSQLVCGLRWMWCPLKHKARTREPHCPQLGSEGQFYTAQGSCLGP